MGSEMCIRDRVCTYDYAKVFSLNLGFTRKYFANIFFHLQVISVLEFRLEELLEQDIFCYLGVNEICDVLAHQTLCIRSEKRLLDRLVGWAVSAERADAELALELASHLRLSLLPLAYIKSTLMKLNGVTEIEIDR